MVALTLQVYVAPSVTPFTMIGLVELLATRVVPPLLDAHVTVKPEIGEPLSVPGVNGTRRPLPARVTTSTLGAPGTVAGMIAFEAAESGPAPTEFVPWTRQV